MGLHRGLGGVGLSVTGAWVAVITLRKHLRCGHVGMLCSCHCVASAPSSEAAWGGGLESLDLTLALSKSHGLWETPQFFSSVEWE